MERKLQLSEIRYELSLEFLKGKTDFQGTVRIDFFFKDTGKPLLFELGNPRVDSMTINGKAFPVPSNNEGILSIAKDFLKPGENTILVKYTGAADPRAVRFFKDPIDGEEYFYTYLSSYRAQRLFPCFNQPDLPGKFKVKIRRPSDWKAIANENVIHEERGRDFSISTFAETPLIIPDLVFIAAGPFAEWTDTFGKLPLRLYTRQTLKAKFDPQNIFFITKKGLEYFNQWFQYPYPYSKYDQIFLPDFAPAGMENVAAVALGERFIFNGKVPESYRVKRDEIILHEMAHMWFGNLVRMKWWNELWLNESFALYMAAYSLKEIYRENDLLIYFHVFKNWAYKEDSFTSTTHPVVGEIRNTAEIDAAFDAITYAKGGSSIMQLQHYVGEATFQEGLKTYIKRHAHQNATLKDFLDAINLFSKDDLSQWAESWLRKSGIGSIRPQVSCQEGKISSFKILQSGTLSPHRSVFGFYGKEGKKLKLLFKLPVSYAKAETEVKEARGKACPDFIMPNEDDYDYGHFLPDEKSLLHVKEAFGSFNSALSRLQLYTMLVLSLKHDKLTPEDFFESITEGLRVETNAQLLSLLIGVQNTRLNVILDAFRFYMPQKQREMITGKIDSILYNRFLNADYGTDLRLSFFQLFVTLANSSKNTDRFLQFLKSKDGVKGIEFTQELRWLVIRALSQGGHPEALKLIDEESKKDTTLSGETHALTARVRYPFTKEESWKLLTDKRSDFAYGSVKEAGEYFFDYERPEMMEKFYPRYFDYVSAINWHRNFEWGLYFFMSFFPFNACDQKWVTLSSEKLKASTSLTHGVRFRWLQANDQLSQCTFGLGKAKR